jgi:hypothetical protein
MTAARRPIPPPVLVSFAGGNGAGDRRGVVALREQCETFRVGEECRHTLRC